MSAQFTDNPYKTLGIDPGATEAEIRQAYFAQVREHPPERDPEGFKRIRAAYEKLRSPGERAQTDLFIIDDQPISPALRAAVTPIPEITPEMIKADVLAMEALLLLEELKASATDSTE